MSVPVPPTVKKQLKGWLKKHRLAFLRVAYGFGVDELLAALRRVGVPGDGVVMVHSSLNAFSGFRGKYTDILAALERTVGTAGTILMPTNPFSTTAVDWAQSGKVLDVRRTPSQVGMLTELFRRLPGTVRSAHPTHPVAARGPLAQQLCADHYAARTPCGAGSPYHRLLERDGQILFLGADIEAMTFFHTTEEILEPKMPRSPFTDREYELNVIDAAGQTRTTRTRLYDPEMSRRRRIALSLPTLRAGGTYHAVRVGTARLTRVRARDVLHGLEQMAAAGCFCYEH